ncbi:MULTISPECIES: lysophospholipid acyltransferase family protein [Acidithiobacillus]|jgi:1-acyl-sn-glycerol-3-phosphate acyltransferase|uniref:Acyltransferase n=2 Tax=Acidithiobacillus TaxID=119977 RepID=A0A179BKT7_ACIFR|nr:MULTISPECIES: lysophospholipid acyltransferase family protein [Acidithiobacillus]MDA8153356.1 lysophospholipid acyltransferase family protein [Acidithiobacillus sp.]MBU2830468.1 1-acyl-sn-glycerol-3-phosphate acyltransferase [Acidithiobacillus ferriphilus]MBU2833577.1 1-acyl-sn-glycerol-3-phosphate acyltransferase [Acidithiobacillus ferriphilus]MBU2854069.1 1-acyl-sn-glycerol-3-phosphate acyltransferase [Acidithiobacillus ferriphilus]MBW9249637.1 1-acyl-sn-glycerol-3-phosphate acyltransfera
MGLSSAAADQATEWSFTQRGLHALLYGYTRFYQGGRWELSSIPATGPAILACNHVSVLDPLFLVASNSRMISFLVAQEYYDKAWMRRLLEQTYSIPVRRDRRDVGALLQARRLLEDGRVLGIFPEGGINRRQTQKGLAWLVRESAAPVVPAHISGARQGRSDLATWLHRQRPLLRYGVPLHFHRDADAAEVLGATMSAIATLA